MVYLKRHLSKSSMTWITVYETYSSNTTLHRIISTQNFLIACSPISFTVSDMHKQLNLWNCDCIDMPMYILSRPNCLSSWVHSNHLRVITSKQVHSFNLSVPTRSPLLPAVKYESNLSNIYKYVIIKFFTCSWWKIRPLMARERLWRYEFSSFSLVILTGIRP